MKRLSILIASIFIWQATIGAEYLYYTSQVQSHVNVYDVNVQIDAKQDNQYGLMISFYCVATGYKGYPVYFYTYFLNSNYSKIQDKNHKDVYAFSVHTCIDDKSVIFVKHFIPYTKLPSENYGNVAAYIICYDGFDNLIYQGRPFNIRLSRH